MAKVSVIDLEPSASVRELIEAYDGLEWEGAGGLSGGGEYLFLCAANDRDAPLPTSLPSIQHAKKTYFVIPTDTELDEAWIKSKLASPRLPRDAACGGTAFIPVEASDLAVRTPTNSDAITTAINTYRSTANMAPTSHCPRPGEDYLAWKMREAPDLLERERRPSSGLYASAADISETTPMLIDGLMRERGVSVVYGDFDEFKTTVVLDAMAHVATGAPWQGRPVKERPVIWYALEGKDEMPLRLRALETRLKGKDTAWGNDLAPVTVFDRIPDDDLEWRSQINRTCDRWEDLFTAREMLGEMPTFDDNGYPCSRYILDCCDIPPVVVIDTLSIALGGEDEKGPAAVGFVNRCLDLLKHRPDLTAPADKDESEWWQENFGRYAVGIASPVASHVIIIHHQTKTGEAYAGHRAIGGNTSGLYRVHRFGKMTDRDRSFAGQITPMRVKGVPRPAPIRFEVEIVPVEGTKQTAAILKEKAAVVPKTLAPVIEALCQLEAHDEITAAELNACIDEVAENRVARMRIREKLEAVGVVEPVLDDGGKIDFYRFTDPGAGIT